MLILFELVDFSFLEFIYVILVNFFFFVKKINKAGRDRLPAHCLLYYNSNDR